MKRILSILACALLFFTAQASQFQLVTDVTTLANGDEIVFGYQNDDATITKVSSTFQSNKESLTAINATLTDNVMVADPTVITLTKLANGNFTMAVGGKPIGHTAGSNKFDTKQKTTTEFAISIAADGVATVNSQTTTTYNFYFNTGSPRFGLYSSSSATNGVIKIYRLLEEPAIVADAESVELNTHALSVRIGETASLTATVLPDNAGDKSVTWGTLDSNIATVADGVITPVATGTVGIYVQTTVGAHRDTCLVTVLPVLDNTTAGFNIVQFPDTLKSGTRVFFGTNKDGKDYIMSRYESGTNIKGVAATYSTDRHSVTAALQYAYTVEREGNTLYFRDCDGRYLSATATNSTTAVTTKDTKCAWTLAINSDNGISTLKNAYYTSTSYYLLFNHTASPVCFKAYTGTSTNIAELTIYSDNAPVWYERERHPHITVTETALDWGSELPGNNIWGSIKYIHFTTEDLSEPAQVIYTGDDAFYCGWTQIPATTTSGQMLVEWSTETAGTYSGEIRITYPGLDDIVIPLSAKAITADDPSIPQPFITVSTERIYINLNYENNCEDAVSFTFSAGNLDKTLYCKWENTGTMPTWGGTWYEAYIGSTALDYGSATQLGTDDITDATLEFYIGAAQDGTYQTSFYFYTYKDKQIVAEKRVVIDIIVSVSEPTPDPTPLDEVTNDQSQIKHQKSQIYNLLGQPVTSDYSGIIIRNGVKVLTTND